MEKKNRAGFIRCVLGAAALAAVMLSASCANSQMTPSDTTSKDAYESIGDQGDGYYKEARDRDIVSDPESGYKYVMNQLLISCEMGTPRAEIEKICKELNAEIVGYIPLSSDFQIEFKEGKSYKELKEEAERIEKYPFVLEVTFNHPMPPLQAN